MQEGVSTAFEEGWAAGSSHSVDWQRTVTDVGYLLGASAEQRHHSQFMKSTTDHVRSPIEIGPPAAGSFPDPEPLPLEFEEATVGVVFVSLDQLGKTHRSGSVRITSDSPLFEDSHRFVFPGA